MVKVSLVIKLINLPLKPSLMRRPLKPRQVLVIMLLVAITVSILNAKCLVGFSLVVRFVLGCNV